MKLIAQTRSEWERSALFLIAFPLLTFVGIKFLLGYCGFIPYSAVCLNTLQAELFLAELILAGLLAALCLVLLFRRSKLTRLGFYLLVLAVVLFFLTPAVTICY